MPEDGTTIKLTNIPMPCIEIQNGCKAVFANKEYFVKLDNPIDLLNHYNIKLNIILKRCVGEYEITSTDFTDNINLYLTVIYNNGIRKNYSVLNADVKQICSNIKISGDFNIDDDLICVEGISYQISIKNAIRLKKKICYKFIENCVSKTYFGDAYLSLNKDLNRYSMKIYDTTGGRNVLFFDGILITVKDPAIPDIVYAKDHQDNPMRQSLRRIICVYESINGTINYNKNIIYNDQSAQFNNTIDILSKKIYMSSIFSDSTLNDYIGRSNGLHIYVFITSMTDYFKMIEPTFSPPYFYYYIGFNLMNGIKQVGGAPGGLYYNWEIN